jgi:hypothetical protein
MEKMWRPVQMRGSGVARDKVLTGVGARGKVRQGTARSEERRQRGGRQGIIAARDKVLAWRNERWRNKERW